MFRISVIIPTYNRADILAKVLSCLERQTVPAEGFEVIVVDDLEAMASGTVVLTSSVFSVAS